MTKSNIRNYIGLACTGHENAVAIVNAAGEIVFAEATERYMQDKRSLNVPPDHLLNIGKLVEEYCDPGADLVVARTWSKNARAILQKELEETDEDRRGHRFTLSFVIDNIERAGSNLLERHHVGSKVHKSRNIAQAGYDHHLCHAASGCYSSGFDEALCAVVDGFGEGVSCACYEYKNGEIVPLVSPSGDTRASLGGFYSIVCSLCGFDPWKGEEWKVMGLAPYGRRNDAIYDALCQVIKVDGLKIAMGEDWRRYLGKAGTFRRQPGSSPLTVADLAHTSQIVFRERMFQLLENLYQKGNSKNLVLMGGCALNSSCNGEILANTSFEKLHVYSAPADDGAAIGSALLAYFEDHPGERSTPRPRLSPYLGSQISKETLNNVERFGRIPGFRRGSIEEITQEAAAILAEGKIIGWVQGRAEFGPRALGHRSILADPRPDTMKDRINALVKFREEFRPFAPSILAEFAEEFFEDYQETPYMERVLVFKEKVRHLVPAVVHEDNTGRLQTVARDFSDRYHKLITEFYKLTGVPLLLNTSFNVMGKPIIHSVEDALAVFYTTGLDALVIEDCIIRKPDAT